MALSDDDREELTEYLDGESDPAARARIEARLNRDPKLRAEADSLKQAWDLLDHLPRAEPSPMFTTRTLVRLSAIRHSSGPATVLQPALAPAPRRWVWAATIVGGLAVGWLLTGLTKSSGPAAIRPDDPQLLSDLRLIENLPLYAPVETIDYLHQLDHPDRFGAEALNP